MDKYQCFFSENQVKLMKMIIEKSEVECFFNGVSSNELLKLLDNIIRNIEEHKEMFK